MNKKEQDKHVQAKYENAIKNTTDKHLRIIRELEARIKELEEALSDMTYERDELLDINEPG